MVKSNLLNNNVIKDYNKTHFRFSLDHIILISMIAGLIFIIFIINKNKKRIKKS